MKLYVGSKRKEFVAHKKLLCDGSEYFRKAFTSGFKEGIEGVMYLPEDDLDVVALLVDFLYRGAIPRPNEKAGAKWLRELYYFAEKLRMPELMDKLMDAIINRHIAGNYHFGDDLIEQVFPIPAKVANFDSSV